MGWRVSWTVLPPVAFHGVPLVVAKRLQKFDPEEAFALMANHGIRNFFHAANWFEDDAAG